MYVCTSCPPTHDMASESSGGVVVYEWVEWLRQWLSERTTSNNGEHVYGVIVKQGNQLHKLI